MSTALLGAADNRRFSWDDRQVQASSAAEKKNESSMRAFSGESEPRIALPSTLLANCWRTVPDHGRPRSVRYSSTSGSRGQRSRLCLGVAYSR